MDDINMNNISEHNSLPTEATPKNSELDVFVDLLRKADTLNISNKKEDREQAIECYQKALFGDDNGFEGVFIESVFITLGQNVLAYAKHNFDLEKIKNFLNKINEKIKNSSIVEDKLIKIYQLTFVIDQAVKNQLTHLIEDLVEKARNKYPLPKGWDSQTESYENSYNEMYEDQISREDDNYNESSKNALYKLWMRITTFDYTKLINSSSKNQTQGEKIFIDEEKELEEKFTKLVERVFEETTTKENDIKNFKDTKKNLNRVALPFCNLVLSWTNDSEYKKDNYRKAIPHLYDAINVLWSGEHENDDRYRAKSFMFKTISNVQLKRISARVEEDKMSKAREYFFKLLENLNGRTPSDKEQEYLSDKYKKDKEAFKTLKDELKCSYMDILINDTNNPYRAEHRSHFFKGIIEFCNVTLNIIKGKDNLFYEQILDIIMLLAESTYQKFFTDSKDNNSKKDANFYYLAYYCAELFYVLGDKRKINSCIKIVQKIQNDSHIHKDDKSKLKNLLSLLKIKLDSHEDSNLQEVIGENHCEDVYALISKGYSDKNIKDKLNRQAYYDILKKAYCDNKLDNNNIEFIKDGLLRSKFSEFLIGKVISNQNTDSYRQEIAEFILRYGAKLEAIVTDQDIAGSDSMHVSDEALTLLILPLIQRTIKDIEENDLSTLTENICNCFGSEFARDSATTHYYILELLVRTIILKNSRPIMEDLLTRMLSWRENYYVDNLILRVFTNLIRNHKSTNENKVVNGFKDKLKSKCNPFIVKNFNYTLTSDHTLKANIDDDVYKELLSIFINNLELIINKINNLGNANNYDISWNRKEDLIEAQGKEWNKYILNLFNIANFQLEVGKTEDAQITFDETQKGDYYKKNESKYKDQVKFLSKNLEDATPKANEGLNRFKDENTETGTKTLVDDWERHFTSKAPNEKKNIITKILKAHNTKPMREILYLLKKHPYVKRFAHGLPPDKKAKTPQKLISICKPILEKDDLLLNKCLPFDFGKTLYDYYSSQTWNCWENNTGETIQMDSLTNCESFKDETYNNGADALNKLLTIEGASKTFKTVRRTFAPLTLKLMGNIEKVEVISAGQSDGGYRTYLPSIQDAIVIMESETIKHTVEGETSTLIPRLTAGKDLYIELTNPHPSNANDLNGFMDNLITNRWGGNYDIVKSLWGVCDLAIQCRYYHEETDSYLLAHIDILGEISEFNNEEKCNKKIGDSEEWFKYIIKIPSIEKI